MRGAAARAGSMLKRLNVKGTKAPINAALFITMNNEQANIEAKTNPSQKKTIPNKREDKIKLFTSEILNSLNKRLRVSPK